jgi:HK97 family phage major capsid protein
MQLPEDGMSFTIPRGTTGASAAVAAENAAWSETDQAVTDLTFRAELVTSQQDISRATFMRGGAVVDQIVFPDMVGAYQTALNAQGISGTGTSPQHRGILNVSGISAVAYTDASPTVGEILPKIQDGIQRINTLRFAPATAIFMHPRRWAWFKSAVDTTGRPVLPDLANVPMNAVGVGSAAAYGQVVGTLGDLPVITDASIPTNLGAGTNEDIIVIARTFDIHLWEDNGGAPFTFTFEQTQGPQTVRLAVGGFSAFTAGRYPTAISTVGGTGLVAPTF